MQKLLGEGIMRNCKVISIINWKGGVGKTTLTHHLGTGFAHLSEDERLQYLGKKDLPKVLLIDNDAQCSLSVSCLGEKEYEDLIITKKMGTIADLYVPFLEKENADINVKSYILKWAVHRGAKNVYPEVELLPAHQELIYTDMDIAVFQPAGFKASILRDPRMIKLQVLARMLKGVMEDYDFIFIDCPPNLNYITQNALYLSDYYLIPTQLDFLSSYGISYIINKVNDLNSLFAGVQADYKPVELIGIVANRVKEYNKEPKGSQSYILERLYETFGEKMFQNWITEGDGISAASAMGCPVYALESVSANAKKQAKAMMAVLFEMLERLKG